MFLVYHNVSSDLKKRHDMKRLVTSFPEKEALAVNKDSVNL